MNPELKKIVPVILAMFYFSNANSQNFTLLTNWKYTIMSNTGRPAGTGNPLPFPDARKPNSILASTGCGLVRLDPSGRELFSFKTSENLMVPAIGDLEGNGKYKIVIPTSNGTIYCVDENGRQLWKNELKDNLYDFSGAVVADLEGDGKLESLFNARAGTIYCLNSDGTLRFKVLAEPRACNPAVGDIDGDGKAEIFYGTDVSKIFCLDHRGRYIWHTEIRNGVYGRSSPVLADLNGDGRYELIMPHSNTTPYPAIVVLDAHSGKLLWKGNTVMQNYGGVSVADLDKNGLLEVVVVDKGNTVNVFNCDGSLKWRTTLSGHGMFYAAGIADFIGDGNYELLCGCRQTGPDGQTMFLLDHQGKIMGEYKEGGDRQTSPVIADLNGDGIPEIYSTDVAQKNIVSYTLEGSKAGGDIPWPYWKMSPGNSGFIPSIRGTRSSIEIRQSVQMPAVESLTPFIGKNTIRLKLPAGYQGSDLFCETRVTDAGKVVSSMITWIENKNGSIEIPFTANLHGNQKLEYILRDRNTRDILLQNSINLNVNDFQCDKAYVKTSGTEMGSIVKQLPSSDFALGTELVSGISQAKALLAGMGSLKESKKLEAASATIERNRQKINFSLSYARFLSRIRHSGIKGTFYAWQNPNPWDEVRPEDVYPLSPSADTTKIEILAMGNEKESVAIDITNLTESGQVVKIYPGNIRDSHGNAYSFREIAEFREAINTPNNRGKMTDEALPKLNEANTLSLGAMETRKLWVTLGTGALKAGRYSFRIGIESVGLVESVQNVVIEMEVSPVRVPEKNEFAFNTWSSIEIADDIMREKVVKDLIDHKIGVFSMLPGPRFFLDGSGKVTGDWAHWDKLYTPLKDKVICFVTGALSVDTKGRQVSREEYAAYLKEAYALAQKGMAERGIDKKQWAIYVMDEPALTGYPSIELAVNIAREIKAACPDMELYIDPAGMVTPETMKAFEGLIDIYSPQIDLLKDPDGKLLDYFHRLDKRLWFYEAPSPARTFHPLGHYRVQGWLAFDYGLTGSGFWCYNSNNVNNLWRVTAPDDYDAVYNDGTSIIPSRRWEASRDGAEDYHLLMMLRRKIEQFKAGQPEQKKMALEAEEAMWQRVRNITANVKKIAEINRDFIPYEVNYSLFAESRKTLLRYLERMDRM